MTVTRSAPFPAEDGPQTLVGTSPTGRLVRYVQPMHDEVTVRMNAPAERIWAIVSDITQTGKFSPETVNAEWLDGATGPAAGVRFRGQVKRNGRGPKYWTKCTILVADPGREFTFSVGVGGKAVNTWKYRFQPVAGGTDVTESFTLAPTSYLRLYWKVMGRMRGRTNVNGMRETLNRIKTLVESEPSAGS
jgi:uncharacterized protein YndB with AHSA1/START domain